MQRFLKNLTLFLIPGMVVLIFPTIVLFWSGEFYSVDKIGKIARDHRAVIIGLAYTNYAVEYQLQETIFRKPKILALGSSRVGQFRSLFFREPDLFYNTTGAIGAISFASVTRTKCNVLKNSLSVERSRLRRMYQVETF